MKTQKITVLLVLGTTGAILATYGQEALLSFEAAKEQGRLKSRYLHVTPEAAKTPALVAKANLAFYQKSVGPVLKQKCMACHGPAKAKGRFRVDQLNPDLITGPDAEKWREVFNALSKSEMPPADEPDYALADADRARIVDWLTEELNTASLLRRNNKEHSSFRRLTSYEYNYALQDLLGLQHVVPTKLPPETASEDGFKNSSDMLQMSVSQFETYREIGLKALRRATAIGERPQAVTYIISMNEEMEKAAKAKDAKTSKDTPKKSRNQRQLFNRETGDSIAFGEGAALPRANAVVGQTPAASPVVLVLPRGSELKLNLDRFLPDEGTMRVRVRAGRSNMNPDEFASLRLTFSAHTSNNANFSQVVSERDIPVTASVDEPQFIDFHIPLSDIQRNPFRKLTTTFPRRDEFLHIQSVSNAGGKEPLQVLIDYVEISAPFFEQWPPKSHTEIFFASNNKNNEQVYGREVLNRFLRRVWRRPVAKPEVDQFMTLFAKYRPGFPTFEGAMIEVMATALATPEFLYLTQRAAPSETNVAPSKPATKPPATKPATIKPIALTLMAAAPTAAKPAAAKPAASKAPARISDVEFASRLSIFLWSSIPDDELLTLAEQGKIRQPAVLAAQVKRMLADPRSRRFTQNFVDQWLGLERMNSVNHVTDESLKAAMLEEPKAYFDEVLKNNRSVMDFIQSDYAVVNERLAAHYRIPKVSGPDFRKVAITPQANRGGILTSAAMLTINSDGKDAHIVKRGVWLMKRILDDPPPPAPPNVPTVDLTNPEILKMTVKERIVDHRNKPACLSCHAKIDPWGIAFENYDALGAYRTSINNKPVDATAELFNKQTLAGIDGLKLYLLLDRQDQFARAMVHKLTAYALGRPLTFADRADVDNLTVRLRKQDDKLGDLIALIITSDLFNTK